MRKLLLVVLCVLFVVSLFSFRSFADEEKNTDNASIIEEGLINPPDEPDVYAPCSGENGICQMYRRGVGSIYNKSTHTWVLDECPCWQCVNCYTVMVTSGDPGLGYPIGSYAMMPCSYEVSRYGTIFVVSSNSEIHYTSSSSLEGYRFRYYAY